MPSTAVTVESAIDETEELIGEIEPAICENDQGVIYGLQSALDILRGENNANRH